jgi:hypothetical protein
MLIHNVPRTKAQASSALLDSNTATVSLEDQRKAAKHREIALNYARQRRKRGRHRTGVVAFRLRDLQEFFGDKYGSMFPADDDGGLDDLVVLLHHVAQLGDARALRAAAARWAPWLSDKGFTAITAEIDRKPLRWRADSLARRIGLYDAKRTELGITTIGAVDFGKAKRENRTKCNDAAYQKARRAKAGATPHSGSAEQIMPWLALGISRPTYYRNRRNAARETDSSGAAKAYVETTKQYHDTHGASPTGESAAPDWAPCPARAAEFAEALLSKTVLHVVKRDSAIAGRSCLHWLDEKETRGKNPVDNYHLHALASNGAGCAA